MICSHLAGLFSSEATICRHPQEKRSRPLRRNASPAVSFLSTKGSITTKEGRQGISCSALDMTRMYLGASASADANVLMDTADEVRQLRNEMEFLCQKVEFLKNFINKDFQKTGRILMNEPSAIFESIHSLVSQPKGHLSVSEIAD